MRQKSLGPETRLGNVTIYLPVCEVPAVGVGEDTSSFKHLPQWVLDGGTSAIAVKPTEVMVSCSLVAPPWVCAWMVAHEEEDGSYHAVGSKIADALFITMEAQEPVPHVSDGHLGSVTI